MAEYVDWDALATLVLANYAATGQWYMPSTFPTPPSPTPPPITASTPIALTIGTGTNSLVLSLSEDAYKGDAQYTIAVDGVQIGGVLTAQASRAAGQHDTITVKGDWAPGSHSVSVTFLNDAWDGTAATDRNLYMDGATWLGAAVAGGTASLLSAGSAGFTFTQPGAPTTPSLPVSTIIGAGADSLVLLVSEDAYKGDAQYTIAVDGVQIGGVLTAQASRAAGQNDTITVKGDWGPGNHNVSVTFLNDAWDGTAATDRNLYLGGATFNGASVNGSTASLLSAGSTGFSFTEVGVPVPPPPAPPPALPVGTTPGYTVVFRDDFSQGYNLAHWGKPFPDPYPAGFISSGAFILDPAAVAVRDGEMQITTSKNPDGSWSSGGFSSFKAGVGIKYGTVDFDARVDAGHGTASAFLMWPLTDTWPPEIDILETPQSGAMSTLHWGGANADASIITGRAPDPTQWHHYTLTWLPNVVEVKTDGVVTASWNYNIPEVGMGFGVMGFVGSQYSSWMGGPPDSTTPPVLVTHMDNVVMMQWNGIA